MVSKSRFVYYGMSVLSAFALAPLANAQALNGKPKAVLEEVVVTARRREEGLQETPLAITALSADYLDAMGVSSIADVETLSPSLQFSQTNYKAPAIFIRGIGQRSGNPVLDPGVGVYLNGVYVPRSDAQLLDAVDVANIQVLRGPQGTLFGKNNIGGALLVDSKRPNADAVEVELRVTAGSYGRKDGKLTANIPWANDAISTRFAVNSKRSDGYIDNVNSSHNLFDEDRLALSQRTIWYATDTIEVDVFSFLSRIDERGTPYSCRFQNSGAILTQGVYRGSGGENLQQACDDSTALADHFKVSQNDQDAVYAIDNQMHALTLRMPVFGFDMESVTSIAFQDNIRISGDSDGSSVEGVGVGSNAGNFVFQAGGISAPSADRNQFTQELKFNGSLLDDTLNLTFGVFYAREELNNTLDGTDVGDKGLVGIPGGAALGLPLPIPPELLLPVQANTASLADYENETRAIFAQASWDVNHWLQLTLGLRYTEEERSAVHTMIVPDYDEYANRLNAQIGSNPAILLPVVHLMDGIYSPVSRGQYFAYEAPDVPLVFLPSIKGNTTFSEFTPLFTANFIAPESLADTLNFDSLIAYFTLSDGFKSGGLDVRSTQTGSVLQQFDPEQVRNTEFGIKIDALDQRLRFNVAVYQLDYTDLQVALYERGSTNTEVVQFTGNAGKAVVDGFEIELTALLGNWTINANAGYTDGDFIEYDLGTNTADGFAVVDRSGEAFPQVPQNVRGMVVQYDWQSPIGRIVPSLQYYYSDEIFIGTDYLSADYDSSFIAQYETFNARVLWDVSEQLSFSGYVNNLKDASYFVGGIAVTSVIGVANRVPGSPRQFGVEMNYRFQ
ncbi:TonB-dependent receptor [Zhongshania aquimaris]|uniref:TonB-dependent receptor n=1 Tax=Zhongshania aquimaris TaxID=2857107 RepID=A0ABS6VUI2_9GAMM|nr:TonB-dependent receptor [Zhongshania aquimaris]MBW2941990.1 TonB-dependent receptor [Zhongshania aquimaris]